MSKTEETAAGAEAAEPTVLRDALTVASAYFDAIDRHDVEAAVALWAPGGRENVRGQVDTTAPDGVRAFLGGMLAAMPDARMEVLETTVEGERCAVRWVARGTFTGEPLEGIEPTGARVVLEGCDVIVVRKGQIVENNGYIDGVGLVRQIGLLPPKDSRVEHRMTAAFNARTRLARRFAAGAPEPVAEGVWRVRGGFPLKTMNVYLVRDGAGVLAFDAGVRSMTNAIGAAAASLGGLTRVVLGHAHPDHRGAAPGLGVPVYCHPAERAAAEGDGGIGGADFSKLDLAGRLLLPRLLARWDGGPVEIAGIVEEGEQIAGFRVIHLPGHAPGQIGLWRESDRLALSTDCFYTLDVQTGRRGGPRVPIDAFNLDTEQARASVRKLAAMEPAAAWPGHADPVTGDVRAQLELAADTT
jgi:glyoxylase-like metal-dependent hydrolase (beta-lactamase superfamily II)/predicted ester cyclase